MTIQKSFQSIKRKNISKTVKPRLTFSIKNNSYVLLLSLSKPKFIHNTAHMYLQHISKQNCNRLHNSCLFTFILLKEFPLSLRRCGRTADWKAAYCTVLAEAETHEWILKAAALQTWRQAAINGDTDKPYVCIIAEL